MAGFFRRALGGRRTRAGAHRAPEPRFDSDSESASADPGLAESGIAESGVAEPTVGNERATERSAAVAGADHWTRPLIFGQVMQSENIPLAGATVTLTDLSGRQLDRDSADSGGHYRLGPPTGGSYLVICASAAHQPTAALVPVADVPVRHDIVLSGAGASLSGVVSTVETGQPLTEAMVTLVDIHGDVVGAVSTDPEGRFSFVELAQGHYTLTVAAPSRQPVACGVEVPATGHVSYDVPVSARVQLVGVVRAATAGTPVPEALTTLIAADGQVVASALTDAAGGFVFDDLDAGVYTLIAAGYPPVATEVRLDAGESAETVLTLRPPTPADAVAADGALGGTGREAGGHGDS